MMPLRLAFPAALLDLNKLSELSFIDYDDTHIKIGAMVRYSELLQSAEVGERIPLFAQALPFIAHEAIRNRGTMGGSIALADPAAEMPALLKALNATITIASTRGLRTIAADDFFLGIYETALNNDELVHSVTVPIANANQRFGFYELARRHGDYAMAGVAIAAQSVEPYAGLRMVFFSIGDYALRAPAAEAALNGKFQDDAIAIQQAQDALLSLEFNEDLNASGNMKAHLSGVVMRRALQSMRMEQH